MKPLSRFKSVLLDTNALLYYLTDEKRLGPKVLDFIADSNRMVFVSSISIMEISIKASLGKLDCDPNIMATLKHSLARLGFASISFSAAHAYRMSELKKIHKDPFDLMIIAQAYEEGVPVITSDKMFSEYPIETILI